MSIITAHGNLNLASGNLLFGKSFTEFPENPVPYQVCFKDGVPYTYTSIGDTQFFSWIPLGQLPSSYLHLQYEPLATWTINHGMGSFYVGVFVYDQDHNIQMTQVRILNENTVEVSMGEPTAGSAIIFVAESYTANTLHTNKITLGSLVLTDDNNGHLYVNDKLVIAENPNRAIDYIGKDGYNETIVLEVGKSYLISELQCNNKFISLPENPITGDVLQLYFDGAATVTNEVLAVTILSAGKKIEYEVQDLEVDISSFFVRMVYSTPDVGWKVY